MNDTIKRYSKHKGYESLPRELLQNTDLSLESIGLIANISSYPDTWILRKTELQKRFPKNKRTVIDRIWDELVENNYIIQFRKRTGKSYEYRYFYNVEPFKLDEIQELLWQNFDENFVLYHKAMKQKNFNNLLLTDYIFADNKDMLDCRFWTVENQQSKKHDYSDVSSNVDFGQSKMDSRKSTLSKLTNKEIYYKDKDEEEDIFINNKEKNKSLILLPIMTKELKEIEKLLKENLVLKPDRKKILLELENHYELQNLKLIEEQLKWCEQKERISSIGDYPKYFIKGLKMRYSREGKPIDSIYDHIEIPIYDFFNRNSDN